MKKDLLILSSKKYPNDKSIFDIKKEEKIVTMFYAKLDQTWTNPGKLYCSLENDGNGFIFKDFSTNKKFRLDYCQAQALRALLKIEDKQDDTFEYLERK